MMEFTCGLILKDLRSTKILYRGRGRVKGGSEARVDNAPAIVQGLLSGWVND